MVAGIVAVAVVGVLIAVAVMVITGFMFAWGFWIVLAWFIFGRGRHGGWPGGRRSMQRGRRTQVRYAHRRTLL